jgi:phospholipase D1/2
MNHLNKCTRRIFSVADTSDYRDSSAPYTVNPGDFSLPKTHLHKNCFVQFFSDGKTTFEALFDAINQATSYICICGWSLRHKVLLVESSNLTIGELLLEKSKTIPVYILLWRNKIDLAGTGNNETYKFLKDKCKKESGHKLHILANKHKHDKVCSSHQKFIICDNTGFLGGIDIAYGRYDTPEHHLFEQDDCKFQDYDQLNASRGKNNAKKKSIPRQQWHDTHCRVNGTIVSDLLAQFITRWDFEREDYIKKSPRKSEPKQIEIATQSDDERIDPIPMWNWNVQLLMSFRRNKLSYRTIYEAYKHAIHAAQRFIYIESQYLIGSSRNWLDGSDTTAQNDLPKYIVNRILASINSDQAHEFRVVIVLPMHPEMNGRPESLVTSMTMKSLLHQQFQSIRFMYNEIGKALANSDHHPNEYLIIGCLGKVERIPNSSEYEKNMIYVHSKLMIVDDEYMIIGSANMNQRSMSGKKDYEIAIGASPTNSQQLTDIRRDLFTRHFGSDLTEIVVKESFMRKLAARGAENRQRYLEKRPFDKGMFMNCPFTVDKAGVVTPMQLDNTEGYDLSFKGKKSISKIIQQGTA